MDTRLSGDTCAILCYCFYRGMSSLTFFSTGTYRPGICVDVLIIRLRGVIWRRLLIPGQPLNRHYVFVATQIRRTVLSRDKIKCNRDNLLPFCVVLKTHQNYSPRHHNTAPTAPDPRDKNPLRATAWLNLMNKNNVWFFAKQKYAKKETHRKSHRHISSNTKHLI